MFITSLASGGDPTCHVGCIKKVKTKPSDHVKETRSVDPRDSLGVAFTYTFVIKENAELLKRNVTWSVIYKVSQRCYRIARQSQVWKSTKPGFRHLLLLLSS